jgi:uncharacterized protein VirK/YbjX
LTLRSLRALQGGSAVGWGRPPGWLGWLRAARLLRHREALEELLGLDIVRGALVEARGPTALSFLANRHLLARGLDLRQRLDCTLYHYRYEQSRFADSYIDAVYRADGLSLWRYQAEEHVYEIRLMVGNDNLYEGFLSAVAFIDGQRVCVISFCYVDAALFGAPAGVTLFVARKQSGRHPEHLRAFARSFKHTSPPFFCFAAVAGVARAIGADQIAAVRARVHPDLSGVDAEVLHKTYDEFWMGFGARELDEKAYRIAVPLEFEDPMQVSAAHRRRARRRREDRQAVEESACSAIRVQLAAPRDYHGNGDGGSG